MFKNKLLYLLMFLSIFLGPIDSIAQECDTEPGTFVVDQNYTALNRFRNHAEAELHYYHCALNNYQYSVALNQVQGALDHCISLLPDGLPPSNVDSFGCTKIETFVDGSGGMVWKPIGDANKIKSGAPTFLLKSNEAKRVSAQAVILGRNAQSVGTAKLRGLTNGDRPTYDVSVKATDLDPVSPIVVRYERDGAVVCRLVPKASQRQD